MIELLYGDNIELLRQFPDNVIDSVVTDPPYGISFLKKKWDYDIPVVKFWKEVYRVLKPGGHILVFCGTRTQHRMVTNIEDAGFEIRDIITWLYGEGMPHGYNIAKGIENTILRGNANTTEFKELKGDERKKGLGYSRMSFEQGARPEHYCEDGTYKVNVEFETEEAQYWDGWNTALKPACEFITLARKPISEKNLSLNVLKWGTGGINIDATRIELNGEIVPINKLESWSGFGQEKRPDYIPTRNEKGRWPSNLILDEVSSRMLDAQAGTSGSKKTVHRKRKRKGFKLDGKTQDNIQEANAPDNYGDAGGKSRFFYCIKPKKKEKWVYCRLCGEYFTEDQRDEHLHNRYTSRGKKDWSHIVIHPTVKPVELMSYLVKLITPYDGICLDPYMGSGTTGVSCTKNGYQFIGMELDKEYFDIAKKRIGKYVKDEE